MRQIVSIPYKQAPRLSFAHYPAKEKLCTPDFESHWTEISSDDDGFEQMRGYLFKKYMLDQMKGRLFDNCKKVSKKFPRRFAISGDHGFTYPLLADDDIEQLVVLDQHEDGVLQRQGMQFTDPDNGTWAYWLTKARPDIRYVGMFNPCSPQAMLHTRERAAGIIPVAKTKYVSLKRLKDELESVLKDKRTALSICADCCDAFKSKYICSDNMFTPDELIETINMINDRTDLAHVDLMEISLEDKEAISAGKKVLDTVMRL